MELYTALLHACSEYKDSIAFDGEMGRMTYTELLGRSNVVGHQLQERFGSERQNIALLIPNTPYFPLALFGLLGAGHVAVPFNPLLNPEELAALMEHGECKVMLYDPYMEESAKKAQALAKTDIEIVSVADLLATESPNPAPFTPQVGDDELAMILYTSGTTGDPKGVMLSHKNVYSNFASFSKVFDFSSKDTFPCVLPLFHTFAMTVIIFGALLNGARILLFPQFAPQKLLETIFKEKSIILIAVPPMFLMLARFAPENAAEIHNLRITVSGGGALPVDIGAAFEKAFNHPILEGYGLTETSPAVAVNRPDNNKPGTIGLPLPDVEVELRDEDGTPVLMGEVGELCVRGDLVMQGYYKNDAATAAVMMPDGFIRTGDLGLAHESGQFQIVGRSKDIIVSGGENIYPREVEETLLRYPGVMEAAVVAKADKLRTEVPYAFVVLEEEVRSEITESELRKYCREHLGEYKIPVAFQFIEEMPKTATRKIQKEKLRALLA
ncbi:AMP-binding protein [bacterium]|nr:AMP-binding protein [bacterium]